MAYLINRNPDGRLICLHALTKYLANRFSNDKFELKGLKYDAECTQNIHQTCTQLIKPHAVQFSVCPYLDNELSDAKCYLTQSLQEDRQKSKSASDAFNALEGLGLINRDGRLGHLTNNGLEFARSDFNQPNTFKLIQQAVMRYGPFWALLFFCNREKDTDNVVRRESVKIGYPKTEEILVRNGQSIVLSTGSQDDTVTRTRSVLFAWGVTAGFLLPIGLRQPDEIDMWHVGSLPFISQKQWTVHNYKVFIEHNLFNSKPYVDRPLEYNAMTKSTKALRERNQETQRETTLELEEKIRNRRFAISYLLALSSEQHARVHFDKMLEEMILHERFFVIDKHNFAQVMRAELEVAFPTGIPFQEENHILTPLTRLNIGELISGAPEELIKVIQDISLKVIIR